MGWLHGYYRNDERGAHLLALTDEQIAGVEPEEVASEKQEGSQDATTEPGSLRSEPAKGAGSPVGMTESWNRATGRNDGAPMGGTVVMPAVAVDVLLDDHAVEFEECKRWANSEAGQAAKLTNPAGFANVRAHAEAHLRAKRGQSAT